MRYYLDMFSGIGGFRLGAGRAWLKIDGYYFSEVDKYAIRLYEKRFPEARNLGDIRAVDYAGLPKGDWFVSGGFPCQPHSVAGKKQASQDERDLWPECRRMLRELRPAFAVFENVPGLVISEGGRFFNRVFSEIHESGYDAEWAHIPATAVGAWHLRNRVWIICYEQGGPPLADAESEQRQRGGNARHQPGPSNGGVASGERIMAYAEYKGIHKQGLTANAGAENGKSGRV